MYIPVPKTWKKCPICGKGTRVLETRNGRRLRTCTDNHRFYTEERIVEARTHGGARRGTEAKVQAQ